MSANQASTNSSTSLAPEATEQQLAGAARAGRGHHGQVQRHHRPHRGLGPRAGSLYTIGRHKEGIYVLEVISGSGDLVKELDRRLKVSDLVIRHLVVRVDEDLAIAARARRSARRRRPAAVCGAACRRNPPLKSACVHRRPWPTIATKRRH